MDPLSFTASLLTVIGTTTVTVKTLNKLRRALRDGATELCALLNEISDLQVVFSAVEAAIEERGGHPEQQWGKIATEASGRQLERAKEALQDLDRIAGRCLTGSDNKDSKIAKLRWFREKNRVQKIQNDLRGIRENLMVALQAFNVSGLSRLHLTVNRLSLVTGQYQDQATDSHKKLLEQLSLRLSEYQGSADSQLKLRKKAENTQALEETDSDQDPPEYIDRAPSSTAEVSPRGSYQSATSIQVSASYEQKSCRSFCSCICHSRHTVKTPDFLHRFLGSLFVVCSGIPALTKPCNEFYCRQRSTSRLMVNYQFPLWFWTRSLFLSFASGPGSVPELLLRLPRQIPYVSETYQHCLSGNLPALQGLMAKGRASPFDVDQDGFSLMNNALRFDQYSICRLLLSQGADPYEVDQSGISPFDFAWNSILQQLGRSDKKKNLLEMFPAQDGNLDNRKFTRLHKVVLQQIGRDLTIELEETTSEINIQDNFGRTPLWWAASRGDAKAVRILLRYRADHTIGDNEGKSPLNAAATDGNIACLRALLKNGADVNSRDEHKITPIFPLVGYKDDVESLKLFHEYGADLQARDDQGRTPFLVASQNGRLESACFLLEAGVDINAKEDDGWGSLDSCVFWNTYDGVEFLLKRQVDHLSVTQQGFTMLHVIASYADLRTIEIFQKAQLKGLEPQRKDSAGNTAKDLADQRGNEETKWKEAFNALLECCIRVNNAEQELELNLQVDAETKLMVELASLNVPTVPVGGDKPVNVVHCLELEDDNDLDVFEDAVEELVAA